jgi:pimeloyl-ACP methyl ester carboxylesterase
MSTSMTDATAVKRDQILSFDGTPVSIETHGTGPALLVVHGGMRAGVHYRALAAALADRFTVILTNRRGRAGNAPGDTGSGLDAEIQDLRAVRAATGAELVFGHSAGAVVALEAARQDPPRMLALYEPPVTIRPHLAMDWVARFEAALDAGNDARAMAIVLRGLQMGPKLPDWFVALPLRVLRFTAQGREATALLHSLPRDLRMLDALEGDVQRFRSLRVPALLLGGTASPSYLHRCLDDLQSALPHAESVMLPGVGHNAPDMDAPAAVAAELRRFFSVERQ